ncbi:MAG: ATP-binding cassette domain-containing protein [Rhodoferax sp.]|uniref:ATP-binding cassette domain-containing protein n=1 Tax=Rhodoferax sp. TaxID=50421 RepID=UPI0027304E84|nr:ATP-binding cassette domain-containing protein [Rhodoferax sp.]MDP1527920.1 ATP-binding cassette domain-containing protein [Rhodoferax sp.]MDP1944467.1 ATP-binding cassette domain-containing protein [Rhodoferax sp.]
MLTINNLSLTRGTTTLLEHFNLTVNPGEIVTVSGASGSGKSTLLNWMIGDLDPAFGATGELWLDERRLDGLPIEQRHLGLLFQDDLLFAHLSVGQNLAFALPGRVAGKQERRTRVEQTLFDMGLEGFYERDPATLSGGQRARVSLMRTLLAEPQALLLDEPFSKLDAALRSQFRAYVFEQITRQRIPTLLVTHDPADVPPGGRVIEISDWQG